MRIDVVIPTLGEWSLPVCIKRVRQHIPVNLLILIGPRNLDPEMRSLADIFVGAEEKNVGRSRAKGLEQVQSEFFASIDSDVLISPRWYKWCIGAIQPKDVGACQGYAKAVAKIYGALDERFIKSGGMWGKGLCGLANTLLKTEVVREVGMPQIPLHEDWNLLLRMENAGYRWISNMNLISDHLVTDVDMWKHHILWGRRGGVRPIFQVYRTNAPARKMRLPERFFGRFPALSNLYQIGYYSSVGLLEHPLKENLFEIACRLHMMYGSATGALKSR